MNSSSRFYLTTENTLAERSELEIIPEGYVFVAFDGYVWVPRINCPTCNHPNYLPRVRVSNDMRGVPTFTVELDPNTEREESFPTLLEALIASRDGKQLLSPVKGGA